MMYFNTFLWANGFECISFHESVTRLVICLSPVLLVFSGHLVFVILWRAISIDGLRKSFQCVMGYSSNICLLLFEDGVG